MTGSEGERETGKFCRTFKSEIQNERGDYFIRCLGPSSLTTEKSKLKNMFLWAPNARANGPYTSFVIVPFTRPFDSAEIIPRERGASHARCDDDVRYRYNRPALCVNNYGRSFECARLHTDDSRCVQMKTIVFSSSDVDR